MPGFFILQNLCILLICSKIYISSCSYRYKVTKMKAIHNSPQAWNNYLQVVVTDTKLQK